MREQQEALQTRFVSKSEGKKCEYSLERGDDRETEQGKTRLNVERFNKKVGLAGRRKTGSVV